MDDKALQLSNQVCFPVYSASRLITRAYKPYLDEMGITYPQYLVLMVLWESDNVSVNQITQKLLLNTNTVSPLLKRMEKLELIERNRSIEDERIVIVQLTEKGKLLKGQAKPIPENLLKIMLNENINLSEILQLKEMLNQWIEILSENSKK
ncbi:MAG: MarR family transcriptional regulator [Crocinitomicaceae bacterium]|nr:MarR family transcriptional regulator [Crocinitomicaceae bacterium]MDC0100447.1 MarR family transcriptional regulator [Crocinitomicaceae bacterium]MDC1196178.1 MarR family transcriptional regulator [Crocinitomicaceae bacterium]|tara:strand:- start:679 stop:1131 length:453 start_codon:yes stop_codon:yes gene_type:complete